MRSLLLCLCQLPRRLLVACQHVRPRATLQQITGNFQQIDDVLEADHGSEGTLVLVETEFTRMTDNIFVILDKNNTITGVDFPIDAQVR